mgnify:CR=1 FL=1
MSSKPANTIWTKQVLKVAPCGRIYFLTDLSGLYKGGIVMLLFILSLTISGMSMASAQIKPAPINPVEGETIKVKEGVHQDVGSLKIPGAKSDQSGKYFQENFLPKLTGMLIASGGGIALLFVIIGGIQILTAYGNDEKIATAKKTITWALAGLLIMILAYSIVQIIVSIKI